MEFIPWQYPLVSSLTEYYLREISSLYFYTLEKHMVLILTRSVMQTGNTKCDLVTVTREVL